MESPKDVVLKFYSSDAWRDVAVLDSFLHAEYEQHWHGPDGYTFYDRADVLEHGKHLSEKHGDVQVEISHVMEDGALVALRYLFKVSSADKPDDVEPSAEFIAIWEVRNGKLYRCWEISAPPDVSPAALASFMT